MKGEVRNTRKSRIINEMSEAIWEIVLDGNRDPSKGEIVNAVVESSLGEGASPAVRALLEDEIANTLERYFYESCKTAADLLGSGEPAAYHYVSKAYYRKKARIPRDMEEAQAFVVCFGNGRRGKAAGIRFPTSEDEPDAMMLVATQKSVDVINAAFKTHQERLERMVKSPALPQSARNKLSADVPRLENDEVEEAGAALASALNKSH